MKINHQSAQPTGFSLLFEYCLEVFLVSSSCLVGEASKNKMKEDRSSTEGVSLGFAYIRNPKKNRKKEPT